MSTFIRSAVRGLACAAIVALSSSAFAHGDVTPQAVDTKSLPPLGEQWKATNPYGGNKEAIKVGGSAYAQNCARCHGIDAISGGIAPDLRMIDKDCTGLADAGRKKACFAEIDEYYATTVRKGRVRNGAVYMPPFEGILQQEAVWAIKAYLETRRTNP